MEILTIVQLREEQKQAKETVCLRVSQPKKDNRSSVRLIEGWDNLDGAWIYFDRSWDNHEGSAWLPGQLGGGRIPSEEVGLGGHQSLMAIQQRPTVHWEEASQLGS